MYSERKQNNRLSKIKNEDRIIVIILVLAFLTRLFFFITIQTIQPEFKYTPDSQSYIELAEGLLQKGVFGRTGLSGEMEIDTVRTPGYPILIALTMLISPKAYPVLLPIVQIMLNTLAAYFLIKLTKKVLGFKIAALAGILFAIDFLSISYSVTLLTESLFQSCLILFLFFAVQYLLTLRSKEIIIAGLLLACMAFVRPISYYLPVFTAVGFLVYGLVAQKNKIKITLSHTALLIVFAFGPLLLWQFRNAVNTGYSDFCSITSINMYEYKAASVLARKEGVSFDEKRRELRKIKEQVISSYPNAQAYYDHTKKEGFRIIMQNLPLYASIHTSGMIRVLFSPSFGLLFRLLDPSFDSWWKKQRALLISDKPLFLKRWLEKPHVGILLLIELIYLVVAVLGLPALMWYKKVPVVIRLLLLGSFLYFFILSGGWVGYYRFRVPLAPIYCITASLFVINSTAFLRSKFKKTKYFSIT